MKGKDQPLNESQDQKATNLKSGPLTSASAEMNKPMDLLLALSQKIEQNFDLNDFPKMAFETLDKFEFNFGIEVLEQALSQWLLGLEKLPPQVNLYNVFGEPSVSIFNNEKFSVDLYFWRTNDTLIHSHGFRGAFKVLYGNSLHEEFSVKTEDDLIRKSPLGKDLGSDVLSSKVSRTKFEILKTGDTRTIFPAMGLVHRVLHLDNPTVTLCIRTVNDRELSQWHHLSSGISYRQCNIDELTIKRILYFQFLFESNIENAKDYLNHMLGLVSVGHQLALFEGLYNDEFGLSPEASHFIIENMRTRFEDMQWFSKYEGHYQKINANLFEAQASTGPLKLLAHGINSGYSPDDVIGLLHTLDESGAVFKNLKESHVLDSVFEDKKLSVYQDLKTFAELLLDEENIFNEEHYEQQQIMIMQFIKKIEDQEELKKAHHEH